MEHGSFHICKPRQSMAPCGTQTTTHSVVAPLNSEFHNFAFTSWLYDITQTCFFMAQQPLLGRSLVIILVSLSHSDTPDPVEPPLNK